MAETYVPLSAVLPPGTWPEFLLDSQGGSLLDRIAYQGSQFSGDSESWGLSANLRVVSAAVFPLPLLGGLALTLGAGPIYAEVGGSALDWSGQLYTELCGLRFPRWMLKPAVQQDGEWVADPDEQKFSQISLPVNFFADSSGELELVWPGEEPSPLSLPRSMVGDSAFMIEAQGLLLRLNDLAPIPAEYAALQLPQSWRGVLIGQATLTLPPDFELAEQIIASNCALGTGGFSGTFSLIKQATGKFAGLEFQLKSIAVTFAQNQLTRCDVAGKLRMPFFDELVDVTISVAADGSFLIKLGTNGLATLDKPNLLKFEVNSLSARYLSGSSTLIFSLGGLLTPQWQSGPTLDWPRLQVEQLGIDSDGNVYLDGGWIDLRQQYSLNFYGFQFEITRLGFGKNKDGSKWVGFNGGLKFVDDFSAGVSAEGLRLTWGAGRPTSISLDGIGVALAIPDVLSFKGFVAFRNDPTKKEFVGDVRLELPSLGFTFDAQLVIGTNQRPGPDQGRPYYAIYLETQLPTGVPLGSTGLALYGIAGLYANQMAPNRTAAQSWYDWYAPPGGEVGVTNLDTKWDYRAGGFALGAGVIIGTLADNGYALSSKATLVVSFPGPVFIIEGQASILSPRSSLGDGDPPFRMLGVLDPNEGSVLFALDAQYKYGSGGELIDLHGGVEAYFNWNDPRAWHLYLGQEQPRSKRIRAELFKLFSAEAYYMISNQGLNLGAYVGWDKQWKFGPLKVFLEAWIEGSAKISWQPAHFHGKLTLHGAAGLKVFGFGASVSVNTILEAEVFKPYRIAGIFEVSISPPWPLPDFDLDVRLEWGPEKTPPPLPLPVQEVAIEHPMVSGTWPLPRGQFLLPNFDSNGDGMRDDPQGSADFPSSAFSSLLTVPVDAHPAITFRRPVQDDAFVGMHPRQGNPTSARNVAQGRPARQSSTWLGDGYTHSGDAFRAVDGNTSGNWANQSVTHTLADAMPWWEVDLGGLYLIDTINVHIRTDCCLDRSSDFYVLISERPFADGLAQSAALVDTAIANRRFTNTSSIATWGAIGRPGRYIRVWSRLTASLSLAEVAVMSASPPRLEDEYEYIGDPSARQASVRMRYALRSLELSRWQSGWGLVAAAPKQATGSLLYGEWAAVPAMQDGQDTEQVKLQLWAKTPFYYNRQSGEGIPGWFNGDASGYLCPSAPVDRKVCYDFANYDPANPPIDAWAWPEDGGVRLNWYLQVGGTNNGEVRIPKPDFLINGTPTPFLFLPSPWKASYRFIVALSTPARQVEFVCPANGNLSGSYLVTWYDDKNVERKFTYSPPANQKVLTITGDAIMRVVVEFGWLPLLKLCVTYGYTAEQSARLSRQTQHRQTMRSQWISSDYVLEPYSVYRLKLTTSLHALGEGTLDDYERLLEQVEYAYFRTGGPPGLTSYSAPANQQDGKVAGLDDLRGYVAETIPASAGADGKPVVARPVYRAYDVSVLFNQNYVDQMYRMARRNLGLYLYDQNNRPARNNAGQIVQLSSSWDKQEQLTLDADRDEWVTLSNSNCASAVIDRASIPRNTVLVNRAGYLLEPSSFYEARLVPLLLHEVFNTFLLGARISGGLNNWSNQLEAGSSGSSLWEVGTNGSNRVISQIGTITGGAGQPGGLLLYSFVDSQWPETERSSAWSDYCLNVLVRPASSGGACGLVVRYEGVGSYYRYVMSNGARRLDFLSAGVASTLASASGSYPLVAGRDVQLRVECVGQQIRVYEDFQLVLQAQHSRYLSGSVGLYCSGNAGTRFGDIRLDDLRPNARAAHRFQFTTSRYANFFHHVHSFRQRLAEVELAPKLADAAFAGAVAAASSAIDGPLATPETDQYELLAQAALGAAARLTPAALEFTRLIRNGKLEGFLIQSPEPFIWQRSQYFLQKHSFPMAEPLLAGPAKIAGVRFSTTTPNQESFVILPLEDIDLKGARVEQRPLNASGGTGAWTPLYTIAASTPIRAGTMLIVYSGAADGPSRETVLPTMLQRYRAPNGSAGSTSFSALGGPGVELRLLGPDGGVWHQQQFIYYTGLTSTPCKLLRKADGTGLALLLTSEPKAPPAEMYFMGLAFFRNIGPNGPVLREAGWSGSESAYLHIPFQARRLP